MSGCVSAMLTPSESEVRFRQFPTARSGSVASALQDLGSMYMAEIVLRVRLMSGDQLDVAYEQPGEADEKVVVEAVISTLAEDNGQLRCRHGERLMILYARGIAGIEVAPRGAVL